MNKRSLRYFGKQDCPAGALDSQRIVIVGYGNVGRSFALNLRDSGVKDLTVGNIEDARAAIARADGFPVKSIKEATRAAQIVIVLLPDEVAAEVFPRDVAPHLASSAAVMFASGYCLAYNLIAPPPGVDVLMLAPRMNGEMIRERLLSGQGFHAFLSVEHDASGLAWRRLLGVAEGVGALRAGAFELDARSEANLDLFVEQTLGAVLGFSIMSLFSIGIEAGLPPEAMALELFMSGEMETVWHGFRTKGFERSADSHGVTAQYGGLMRVMQLYQTALYEQFQNTLEDIRSGKFANQFQAEQKAGYPHLRQAKMISGQLAPLTEAENQIRQRLDPSQQPADGQEP